MRMNIHPINVIIQKIKVTILREILKMNKVVIRASNVNWMLNQITGKEIKINEDFNDTILSDYRIEMLEHSDIVLDIGAGKGLYSLLSSQVVKKVYYIEPIITPKYILGIDKIEQIPFAFGRNGQNITCDFWNKKKYVKGIDLSNILENISEEITVIKCDCEGCEWDGFLSCDDFKKVRMIDLEYHLKDNKKCLYDLVDLLERNNFIVSLKDGNSIGLLYATKHKY